MSVEVGAGGQLPWELEPGLQRPPFLPLSRGLPGPCLRWQVKLPTLLWAPEMSFAL